MTREQILEMHMGSEYYVLEQHGFIQNIVNAMEEYKNQKDNLPEEKQCCCNNTTLGQTKCDGLCVDTDQFD